VHLSAGRVQPGQHLLLRVHDLLLRALERLLQRGLRCRERRDVARQRGRRFVELCAPAATDSV
jgi:hypothetical protein